MILLAMLSEGRQWVFIILCVIAVTLIIRACIYAPGANLKLAFTMLGDLKDKTLSDIEQHAGKPTGVSYPGAYKVCTWSKPGYTISLSFDRSGRFVKINSEIGR